MIVARLNVLAKRGEIAKSGRTRNTRWSLAQELDRTAPENPGIR
jgi:hypothetical protein